MTKSGRTAGIPARALHMGRGTMWSWTLNAGPRRWRIELSRAYSRHGSTGSSPAAPRLRCQRLTPLGWRSCRGSARAVRWRITGPADRTRGRSSVAVLNWTIRPCTEQVRDATALIRSTATRLRSNEPLDPLGIARLKTLLRDASGPCYVPSRPDALTLALQEVSNALEVETRGGPPIRGFG